MSDILSQMQAALLAGRGFAGGQAPHLMTIGPNDVHVDVALSNVAVEFKSNEFIADRVMPVIPVNKRSNKFYKFGPATAFSLARADIAGQMGRPAQISYDLSTDGYAVKDYGLMDFVPADVESNADAPLTPLMDSTEIITEMLQLAREQRVADVVFSTSNYGSNTTTRTGSQQWDNPSSDPVADIQTAMRTPLVRPNVMIVGEEVWDALRKHAAVEKYILSRASTMLGAVPLRATEELVAQAFGLDAVLVGRAKYNSAHDGATPSFGYIWGKYCALLRVETTRPSERRTQTFGYTFRYAPTGGSAYETRTWFDFSLGVRGGTWVKVTHSDSEKVVGGQYVGYLYSTVVS